MTNYTSSLHLPIKIFLILQGTIMVIFFASGDGNLDQTVEDERETEYKAEAGVKAGPKRFRKRKLNGGNHVQRKRKRNSGQYYKTRKGTVVQGKQFNNPNCSCRKKCYDTISEQARRNIFESLDIGIFSAQNALICGLVKQETPKGVRPTTNRKKTTNNFLFTVNGKSKLVCKDYFFKLSK